MPNTPVYAGIYGIQKKRKKAAIFLKRENRKNIIEKQTHVFATEGCFYFSREHIGQNYVRLKIRISLVNPRAEV